MPTRRTIWLGAGLVLAFLALLRLGFLWRTASGDSTPGPRPLTTWNQTVKLQVRSPQGQQLRLHFPEIPLNLDYPYTSEPWSVDLKIPLRQPPTRLRVEVLEDGRVTGRSETLTLGAGASVDLGQLDLPRVARP